MFEFEIKLTGLNPKFALQIFMNKRFQTFKFPNGWIFLGFLVCRLSEFFGYSDFGVSDYENPCNRKLGNKELNFFQIATPLVFTLSK